MSCVCSPCTLAETTLSRLITGSLKFQLLAHVINTRSDKLGHLSISILYGNAFHRFNFVHFRTGPEVIKMFMLNSIEDDIYHAHKP